MACEDKKLDMKAWPHPFTPLPSLSSLEKILYCSSRTSGTTFLVASTIYFQICGVHDFTVVVAYYILGQLQAGLWKEGGCSLC